MMSLRMFAIVVVFIITPSQCFHESMLKDKQTKEFCQAEHLHISCSSWKDHVVVVLGARYGRMKIGKCAKGDYGDLGCTMNALFYLDYHCSGEVECRFIVFAASNLREKSPCPEDVASYVEVTYACVEVSNPDKKQCGSRKFVATWASPATPASGDHGIYSKILNEPAVRPSGLISSSTSLKSGIGFADCPWLITTARGLQLSFWLRYVSPEYLEHLDKHRKPFFNKKLKDKQNMDQRAMIYPIKQTCLELATLDEVDFTSDSVAHVDSLDAAVAERGSRRLVTTCDAGNLQDGVGKEMYLTRMSGAIVTLVYKQQPQTIGKFFISYQAVGCADMAAPFNATLKREGQKVTIKCNHSDHTWQMTCKNGTWIGDSINCNQGTTSAWGLTNIFDRHNFPFGILIVVSSGVALGIFLGGLLLVCVVIYMKRQQELNQKFLCVTDDSRLEHHQMITTPDVLDTSYPETGDILQTCQAQGMKRPHGYGDEMLADVGSTKLQATLLSKPQSCLVSYSDAYPTCHSSIGQSDYPVSRSLVACQDYDRMSSSKGSVGFQGCQSNQGMTPNFVPVCPKGVQFCGGSGSKSVGVHLYELPRVI